MRRLTLPPPRSSAIVEAERLREPGGIFGPEARAGLVVVKDGVGKIPGLVSAEVLRRHGASCQGGDGDGHDSGGGVHCDRRVEDLGWGGCGWMCGSVQCGVWCVVWDSGCGGMGLWPIPLDS